MFTATVTRGMCQDLALILHNIAPKDLVSLKVMRMVLKVGDKFEAEASPIKVKQEEMDAALKEMKDKFASAEDPEERAALEKEAASVASPFVDAINDIREGEVGVELSDEQIEFLRSSFKKLIADKLKSSSYAIKMADALEVPDEKE